MISLLQRHRHHYFAQSECVVDKWGDEEGDESLTLTAQQRDVKVGDTVKTFYKPGVVFEVTRVDYYREPSDMFVAHITPSIPCNTN
jgi:hypothetical protein